MLSWKSYCVSKEYADLMSCELLGNLLNGVKRELDLESKNYRSNLGLDIISCVSLGWAVLETVVNRKSCRLWIKAMVSTCFFRLLTSLNFFIFSRENKILPLRLWWVFNEVLETVDPEGLELFVVSVSSVSRNIYAFIEYIIQVKTLLSMFTDL